MNYQVSRIGWAAVVAAGAAGFLGAALPSATDGNFKVLTVKAAPQPAQKVYLAQLLPDLDRPVADTIALPGATLATRVTNAGDLEVSPKNDDKFTKYRTTSLLSVSLTREGVKAPLPVKIVFRKGDDGRWTYRNATQLTFSLGKEALVLVDANANGLYNEPGVDGLTWFGQTYVFPLPGPDEHFCTAELEVTGLAVSPWGEQVDLRVRPLECTVAAATPILQGINQQRVAVGLTPRPENVRLSADLQKHCHYMDVNNLLKHAEDPRKEGYTKGGRAAASRSILSMGTSAAAVAQQMVDTYYHRQDVIRPDTAAFGVGYEGQSSGIDGRTDMARVGGAWVVLYPAPGQEDVSPHYGRETPQAKGEGTPITAYFSGSPKLTSWELRRVTAPEAPGKGAPSAGVGPAVDCFTYEPANDSPTRFQRCVALVPKAPLAASARYRVTMEVAVGGAAWKKTWEFMTGSGGGHGAGRF